MEKILVLVLLSAFSVSCFAQKKNSSSIYSSVHHKKKSKNLKKGAWVLAGLGIGVTIASAINHSNLVKG